MIDHIWQSLSDLAPGDACVHWVLTDPDGYVVGLWSTKPESPLSRLQCGIHWGELLAAVTPAGHEPVPVQVAAAGDHVEWCGFAIPVPAAGGVAGVAWLNQACKPMAAVDAVAPVILRTISFAARAPLLEAQVAGRIGHLCAVVERARHGVVVTDTEGKVLAINGRAAGSLGIQPSAVVGKELSGNIRPGLLTRSAAQSGRSVTQYDIAIGLRRFQIRIRDEPVACEDGLAGHILHVDQVLYGQEVRQRPARDPARATFDSLVGEHPRFREAVRLARLAAEFDETVLIVGESGTGKELFAQAIHNASERRRGPFVAVNCSAIPRHLIATELFGYVGGAFTGARRGGAPGKFEAAAGGTIFLDEIGDMPVECQSALLRILQDRMVMRVGANHPIPVDVRVIAATNRDLQAHVSAGAFRLDLYFRLCVFNILVPSLQERRSDIPLLVSKLLHHLSMLRGRAVPGVSPEAMRILEGYPWPGNIRELQNTLDWAIHMAHEVIRPEHLPHRIRAYAENRATDEARVPGHQCEKERILQALIQAGGNRSLAARLLGMPRRTLYRHLKKLGLVTPRPSRHSLAE